MCRYHFSYKTKNVKNSLYKYKKNIPIIFILLLFSYNSNAFLYENKLPVLHKLCSSNSELNNSLKKYSVYVFADSLINSKQKLWEVLNLRNDIIIKLDNIVCEYYYDLDKNDMLDRFSKVENELRSIGIQVVYNDNMYVSLTRKTIFQRIIAEYMTEIDILYNNFLDEQTKTVLKNNPFLDLNPNFRMLIIGEKMLKKYSKHKYTLKIKTQLIIELQKLTNIYKSKSKNKQHSYIIGGISKDNIQNVVQLHNYMNFIENNKKSKYSSLFRNIIETIPELDLNEINNEEIHLVVIDEVNSYQEARKIIDSYLLAAMDIPYLFEIKSNIKKTYAITYRFYSDFEMTLGAFDKIRTLYPSSKIISINQKGKRLN